MCHLVYPESQWRISNHAPPRAFPLAAAGVRHRLRRQALRCSSLAVGETVILLTPPVYPH